MFPPDEEGQKLRWSRYRHMGKGDELLEHVREKVFPHMKALGKDANGEATTFGRYMADAQLMIQRPSLMISTVEMIDKLPLGQADTKGDKYPKLAEDAFDLVLANPPFKGSLDHADVHSSLTGKVKTKKTELLFLVLMLRMLKLGGRCAVIVPDGVLFGSSKAHRSLRQLIVNDHQLEAVVKLPAGVFRPYAGVSTAVLLFTKGGKTTDVWFYNVESDGFSLDDKRDKIGDDAQTVIVTIGTR